MLFDEDIDTAEGSASNGKLIYEMQTGLIEAWTSNRVDRKKLRDDLVAIVENSNENVEIIGLLPTNFLDLYGNEISVRRCEE